MHFSASVSMQKITATAKFWGASVNEDWSSQSFANPISISVAVYAHCIGLLNVINTFWKPPTSLQIITTRKYDNLICVVLQDDNNCFAILLLEIVWLYSLPIQFLNDLSLIDWITLWIPRQCQNAPIVDAAQTFAWSDPTICNIQNAFFKK